MSKENQFHPLTPYQSVVLQEALAGGTNSDIATKKGMKFGSVKIALEQAYLKTGSNRHQLIIEHINKNPESNPPITDVQLTDIERNLLELVIKGLTYKEIASLQSKTPKTICSQMESIYKKIGEKYPDLKNQKSKSGQLRRSNSLPYLVRLYN